MAKPKTKKPKKRLKKSEFDRKIRIWALLVPLITTLLASATAISVMMITLRSPKQIPEHAISESDKVALERIRSEFSSAHRNLTISGAERDEILNQLAQKEANILRRYDPNFEARYPAIEFKSLAPVYVITTPLLVIGMFVVLRITTKRLFKSRYEHE